MSHPLSDRRAWEDTPAGELHRALGIPAEADRAIVDQRVNEIREVYRDRFRRELTEAEVQQVRLGAELRSAPPAARGYATVQDLVAAVNSSTPGAGWYWSPERPRGAGIAMRQTDGSWTGDPAVVAGALAGEAEKEAIRQAQHEAWANGPAIVRTIARPT